MTYQTQYVTLDDKVHIIGDGQRTACGEVLPYGADWTTTTDGKVCSACTARVKKDAEAAEALDAAREQEIAMPLASDEPEAALEATGKKKG
jgi:hypothetical protein